MEDRRRSQKTRTSAAALIYAFLVPITACAAGDGSLRFGTMLAQTVAMLVLVCGLAVVTLRAAARAGIGRRRTDDGTRGLELLDELPIGARQSVVALRAGGRVLVAARSATGMSRLGEMSIEEWHAVEADGSNDRDTAEVASHRARTFAELLDGVRTTEPGSARSRDDSARLPATPPTGAA